MSKIDVNAAAEIIKKHHVEPEKLRAIVEEMNLATQPDPGEGDGESTPAVKKQFCVLVSDPDGVLPPLLDLVAWVVQIEESESPATVQERINRAAYDFNTTKRGRMLPCFKVGDALENIPAKHHKAAGLWVKTKTPVLVLKTSNEIPRAAE
jgi:hypothetical protein